MLIQILKKFLDCLRHLLNIFLVTSQYALDLESIQVVCQQKKNHHINNIRYLFNKMTSTLNIIRVILISNMTKVGYILHYIFLKVNLLQ